MGLFDRLDKAVEKISGDIKDAVEKSPMLGGYDGVKPPTGIASQAVIETRLEQAKNRQAFAPILTENFPDYQIREYLPVSELGGMGQPYDFGLYQDGQLKAVVIVVGHNKDHTAAYKGAKEAAKAAGIPFINFYAHMPNEHDFVVYRVRSFLTP